MATTKKPAAKKPAAKKSTAKKPVAKKAPAKKAAPKKTTATKSNKKVDAVIIGDEDNKSFKAQEKEISREQNKERKETKKEAQEAFGGKKQGNWFTRLFHKKNK